MNHTRQLELDLPKQADAAAAQECKTKPRSHQHWGQRTLMARRQGDEEKAAADSHGRQQEGRASAVLERNTGLAGGKGLRTREAHAHIHKLTWT